VEKLGAGNGAEGVQALADSALELVRTDDRRRRHPCWFELGYRWNPGEQSCVFAGMRTRALLALAIGAALTGAVVGFLLLGPGGGTPLSHRRRSSRP
jgi:hypothetical protein